MADEEKKKRKSKYMLASRRKRGGNSIPLGRQGFLVTCDGGREQQCGRECINLLDRFFEELGGTVEDGKDGDGISSAEAGDANATENSSDASDKNFDELLKEEIVELRGGKKTRFATMETGCNGVIFVDMLRASISPGDLGEAIVRSVATTKQSKTRFCMKLLPVEVTCYASAEEVKAAAQPMISKHFPEEGQGTKFAVAYEARANTGLDRMTLIDAVAKLVPKPHTVDLKAPQKTIIVQVARTTCCIGVANEFKELAKYNLRQLVLPPEDDTKEQETEEQ